jgi:glycosyltransferase involved in cell wall biosynthesis
MRKPKICFITSFFYPVVGGVETHVRCLGKELIKKGYDVEVYTSDSDRNSTIDSKEGSIDKIRIKRFKSIFKVGFAGVIFPEVFRAVKESDADIFHVHVYRHFFNLSFLFSKKPFFITPHWPEYQGQRNKFLQTLLNLIDFTLGKYIFKHFKKVFVITDLESKWVKKFGVKSRDIVLAPNGLEEASFKKYNGKNFRKKYNLKDKLSVISVSRLHPSKGLDQLVRVAKFFPNVEFLIMGKDGGFRRELESLIQKLGLNNVRITGEITENEKMEAYAGADIFCMPSHYEGFCISILEAMSQGCPVITSNKGGMPWVVGKEGLIFEDNNLLDLRNKLEKLISSRHLRKKFSKQGLEKSHSFTWKKTSDILDKEYKKCLIKKI